MRFRSLSWQKQLFQVVQRSSWQRHVKRRVTQLFWLASKIKWQKLGLWLLILTVIVTMVVWNWRLFLATAIGISFMLLVYHFQESNWQPYWLELERLLKGSNKNLAIAVGSGGIAALSTYLATSIWVNTENRWLATGSILQGLGTVGTFGLLLWHILTHRQSRELRQFELLVNDLTNKEPLKRLLAVRKLTDLAITTHSTAKSELLEYFQLMLSQESESIIKDAIIDSIQILQPIVIKSQINKPLNIPISFPTKVTKSRI
jgi:hypothetical protein